MADSTKTKRWKSSKSTYYTEDILSNLHQYAWAPAVGAKLLSKKVHWSVPVAGLGISLANVVGRVIGKLSDRREDIDQEWYENSLLGKLKNLIPGVAAYNAEQSARVHGKPSDRVKDDILRALERTGEITWEDKISKRICGDDYTIMKQREDGRFEKVANAYLNKIAGLRESIRKYRNTMMLPAGDMPYNATASDYALSLARNAESLRARSDAKNWTEKGDISNIIRSGFTGKGKCNVFPAAVAHTTFGKTNPNLLMNKDTGNLMVANQVYDLVKPGPWIRPKFDGQVVYVPEDLRPYALGATHVTQRPGGHGHLGIITAPFKTTSAATEKGLIQNDWGFRALNNSSNTQAAYLLPKHVNPDKVLDTAKAIKYIDDNTSLIRPFKPVNYFK